ncbi:thiosulfate sulfurtransferase/rhodanese-like domain-containing protein 3 isoform X2 [Phyllostomus hastatus]|uniref:thiosulfate sulfurtransferase/rhodanese-like domain-containing protein 3 isoform X2 n=1 Tax=Phyllostomus hastatus TaxID=9423 RepID=UPI001E68485B|nr:thiosulfate sulfurtransferase/rhodanese-like domain-containing protein 3 isoform X2 [Phyllostomus hastatus]
MLQKLLFGSARRVILGSAEAALWGLNSIKGNCHNFCTAIFKDVTYKELKNLLNSKKIMLIDVRETWEIECGKIPGSVNIPLGEVGEALQMHPEDFKEKYNEVKPSKSDSLVFSCLAGVRSKKALDTAVSLGFNSPSPILLPSDLRLSSRTQHSIPPYLLRFHLAVTVFQTFLVFDDFDSF